MLGPNPSGRQMLDGATEITDRERTEANRAIVRDFVEEVLVGRHLDRLVATVDADLIQHNPHLADGRQAYRDMLMARTDGQPRVRYDRLHRVLAEGNFVLSMCEGLNDGTHTSFYDLWRLAEGRIVEHWDTIETIAPRHEWKNDNGKF